MAKLLRYIFTTYMHLVIGLPALIEDLIKVHAVEAVEEDDAIELTAQQKEALDKELVSIAGNPAYVKPWDDVKHRFKKP